MAKILHKFKKINWKQGSGTTLLSGIMIFVAFLLTITLFKAYQLLNTANMTQMITDVAADGATAISQEAFGVNEAILSDTFNELLEENQKNQREAGRIISFSSPTYAIETVELRKNFTDQLISYSAQCSYQTSLNPEGSPLQVKRRSKVLSLSILPTGLVGGPNARDIQILTNALKQLDRNSIQYKAIVKGSTMLHWAYSKETRWTFKQVPGGYVGSRDCSSFTYTCFQDYCTFLDGSDGSSTQTFRAQAQKYGLLKTWSTSYADKLDEVLDVGDIILTTGNDTRAYNIGHVMIYLGDGYVMHANGNSSGTKDGIHINRYSKWSTPHTPKNGAPIFYMKIPQSMARPNATLESGLYNYKCRKAP